MRRITEMLLAAALGGAVLAGCGSSSTVTPTQAGKAKAATPTTTSSAKKGNYVLPVATIQLAQPIARFTEYVDGRLLRLRPQLQQLQRAADSGDLQAAERAWQPAHVTYLEIGEDDAAYGSFGELGEQIDGLAAGLPNTTSKRGFTGFHRVEFDLWRRRDVAAAARDTTQLRGFVNRLTPQAVAADFKLNSLSVDAWVLRCHEILEDGLRDSLTGNDDYGSNSDLASLSADVTATREMMSVLAPLIGPRGPQIVPTATTELRTLDAAITAAGGTGAHITLIKLPARSRQDLDEATGAATETLAPVSEILQVVTPGS